MPIIEPAIRPPAEAYSFLLQITTGCSSNTCTFCGAYKGKDFSIKSEEEIYSDIEEASKYYKDVRKVFLMDGDALVLSNKKLVPILKKINEGFPKLKRISSYANGFNITKRTDDELQELYENKLKLVYIGLESGSQQVLDFCKKKSSAAEMIEAVKRASKNKIDTSLMLLLGLGGKKYTKNHINDSIKAINEMQPAFLSFLSVMLVPGTELYEKAMSGDFKPLDKEELLYESYEILKDLDLRQTIFACNHASNYLPLEGRLPASKEKLLTLMKSAIEGKMDLRPEYFRGL